MRQIFGSIHNEIPEELLPYWKDAPVWKQVHGTAVAEVLRPSQQCGEVDALFTRVPGIPLVVVTADCVPVVLERRDRKAIAVAHAGWRGTFHRIIPGLWKQLEDQGEKAEHWRALIGPAIGACCYEVDEDLASDFRKHFHDIPPGRNLDLVSINESELRSLGFLDIRCVGKCTRCHKENGHFAFHSYRRAKAEGQKAGRQYSGLVIAG